MTTLIAAGLTLFLFSLVVGMLERTHRREDFLPHVPMGADPTQDPDLYRVLHDLAAHRD